MAGVLTTQARDSWMQLMGQKDTTLWPLWITFTSCLTLGKSLNLPKFQFSSNGDNFQYSKAPSLTSLRALSRSMQFDIFI